MRTLLVTALVSLAACGHVKPREPGESPDAPDALPDSPDASTPITRNATTDFSPTANPNGVWTLGYISSAGAFVTFTRHTADGTSVAWTDPQFAQDGTPAIFLYNASVIPGVPAGSLVLHPGPADSHAALRFTVPSAGRYRATVVFSDGDLGATDGAVFVNGASAFSAPSITADTSHTVEVDLDAGATIDARVGALGDYTADSTPVEVTVIGPL